MSNIIKFERPPEPEAPKKTRSISPALRTLLVWLGLLMAFAGTWAYFSLAGGSAPPA
jgi:hypothetical protein